MRWPGLKFGPVNLESKKSKVAQNKFVAMPADKLNWNDKFMFFTFISVRYNETFSASCAATFTVLRPPKKPKLILKLQNYYGKKKPKGKERAKTALHY